MKYFIFILVQLASPAASLRCVSDIRVAAEARTASVWWQVSPQCHPANIARYEVLWEHRKFLACRDGHLDSSAVGTADVSDASHQTITDLHPYSIYSVTIKTSTKDKSKVDVTRTQFTTKETAPDSRAVVSATPADTQPTSIRFFWAESGDCELQHGRRDGWRVELVGRDTWAVNTTRQDDVIAESYYAGNLQAYTNYQLQVFSRNTGLVSTKPLVIEARTRPTRPLPPLLLPATPLPPHSVHLSWRPAHPPTGLTDRYQLGWADYSEAGQPTWRQAREVGREHQGICANQDEEEVCYVLDDPQLEPGTQYGFRVRASNRDVTESSAWSNTVTVVTPALSSTTSATAIIADPTMPSQPEPGVSSTVVIISLVAGIIFLAFIVTALVYNLKILRLKQQIRQEEQWNRNASNRGSYGGSVATRSSYFDSVRSSVNPEIQSRRLPEPPPGPGHNPPGAPGLATHPHYSGMYELSPLPTGPMLESTRIQEEAEEMTDMEGYLRFLYLKEYHYLT